MMRLVSSKDVMIELKDKVFLQKLIMDLPMIEFEKALAQEKEATQMYTT